MSFFDVIGELAYILDTPGALMRGGLAGRLGERASGRDMLEAWGVLGANQEGLDFGDVAGFGADLLADPLNLLGGLGMARKAMQVSKVKSANRASKAMRAMGAMPEEIAALTQTATSRGAPLAMHSNTGGRVWHVTQNVGDDARAFLDVRNQFDLNKVLTEGELDRLSEVHRQFFPKELPSFDPTEEFADTILASASREAPRYTPLRDLATMMSAEVGGSPTSAENVYHALAFYHDPMFAKDVLRRSGYDAVLGRVKGSGARSIKPLAESQLYEPRLASAIQALPRQSNTLKSILMANIASKPFAP